MAKMAKMASRPRSEKSIWPVVGTWSFYGGVALSIIVGLLNVSFGATALILGVLGVLVGLLNITSKESTHFIIAGLALNSGASGLIAVLNSVTTQSVGVVTSTALGSILANLTIFISPAIGVVALKALYDLAQYGE